MTRAAFLAAVHELAARLGNELYDLVEEESERVRNAALEIALGQLGTTPAPRTRRARKARMTSTGETSADATPRPRKQQRCSRCDSTDHNVRRCDQPEASAEPVAEAAKPSHPPPTEARPLRRHRGLRCGSSRGRASTNHHRAGPWRVTAARSCSRSLN